MDTFEQLRGKLLRTIACSGGYIEFQLHLNSIHKRNIQKLKNLSVVAFKICCLIVTDFHQSKKIMVTRENNNYLCVCVHAVPLMQHV